MSKLCQMMSKSFPNYVQVMSRLCSNDIQMMSKSFPNHPKLCPNYVQMMSIARPLARSIARALARSIARSIGDPGGSSGDRGGILGGSWWDPRGKHTRGTMQQVPGELVPPSYPIRFLNPACKNPSSAAWLEKNQCSERF